MNMLKNIEHKLDIISQHVDVLGFNVEGKCPGILEYLVIEIKDLHKTMINIHHEAVEINEKLQEIINLT